MMIYPAQEYRLIRLFLERRYTIVSRSSYYADVENSNGVIVSYLGLRSLNTELKIFETE